MLIVYDSLTGMGKSFAEKIGYPTCDIHNFKDNTEESIFLITRSIKFGSIPEPTADFLCSHANRVIGCAVTGDKIWGSGYGEAGRKIANEYEIPLVHIFERQGFPEDIEIVKTWIDEKNNQ